ncbi:MAG: hypothetical protein FJZ43_02170 [Candidatus Staskawiczbacteria bacterium]|nr:hypothetical protein [Candidatus Staskawiczbacteria bacterium]
MKKTGFDIKKTLSDLSQERKIFHSEADFQFALAWLIQKQFPNAVIRLERNFGKERKEYLDIWIKIDSYFYFIELKYKTKKLEINDNGEDFLLTEQSSTDTGAYDFIKDIARIERFTQSNKKAIGYVIMLTNEGFYWKEARNPNTNDAEFKLCEGRNINGDLSWGPKTSLGVMQGREKTICLSGSYTLNWHTYSSFLEKLTEFKYLLVSVNHNS